MRPDSGLSNHEREFAARPLRDRNMERVVFEGNLRSREFQEFVRRQNSLERSGGQFNPSNKNRDTKSIDKGVNASQHINETISYSVKGGNILAIAGRNSNTTTALKEVSKVIVPWSSLSDPFLRSVQNGATIVTLAAASANFGYKFGQSVAMGYSGRSSIGVATVDTFNRFFPLGMGPIITDSIESTFKLLPGVQLDESVLDSARSVQSDFGVDFRDYSTGFTYRVGL